MTGLIGKRASAAIPMRVVGLSVLGTAFAALLIVAALGWVMSAVDEVSTQREIKIARRLTDTFRYHIAHEQESATIWDDSVRYLSAPQGKQKDDWIDNNLGSWMHSYFGHDYAFVIDSDDQPVYASSGGERADNGRFETVRAIVSPMAKALRRRLLDGEVEIGGDGNLSPGVSDIDYVEGRPAIVSLKPVISDTGMITQAPGREYIHVAVRRLDSALLNELSYEYGFQDLHFSPVDKTSNFDASMAFEKTDGSILGYFIWSPVRPGLVFLKSILPYLAALYGSITIVIVTFSVLLHRRRQVNRAQEDRIHYLATHDALTGLLNRASFEGGFERLLYKREIEHQALAVLYLDLDRFKHINDSYGHAAGDAVIAAIADRIRSEMPEGALVSRVGGDEFNAVVPVQSVSAAGELCERILSVTGVPISFGEHEITVGTSIGVAFWSGDETDRGELVRQADVALYAAKSSGRGQYAIFDVHMEARDQEQMALQRELKASVYDLSQFKVLYQPKYATLTGQIDSAEALVRWMHPSRGELLPDAFIPLAEEAGVIQQIGLRVLEESCRASKNWPLSRVSVNVSPVQWSDPNFSLSVAAILSRAGFDPNRLELEITESAWIRDADSCSRNIMALRAIGITIALDDFGVGYSSLARLQSMEVDHVKIDKRFIDGIGTSKCDETIVRAIIDMARAKGLLTTAEGVQTEQQYAFLKDIGCDSLQGFLFSRPIAEEDIDALLRVAKAPLDGVLERAG